MVGPRRATSSTPGRPTTSPTGSGDGAVPRDQPCGTLARYLRYCGHDAEYASALDLTDDDALIAAATAEDRRRIARERALGAPSDDAVVFPARAITRPLTEAAAAGVSIELAGRPVRCGRCNGRLVATDGGERPASVRDGLDESTFACEACGQCCWRGSHCDAVRETIESATN